MTRKSLLRERREGGTSPVTFIELFFDLIFVFAVTQLSHRLLENLTLAGLLETGMLFLATWWVWIYTSWVTNWLDPERPAVRLMLLALMLGGLTMSSAIPDAFGDDGLLFAGAYAAMQIGRSLFTIWALTGADDDNRRNFIRIGVWLTISSAFWIAGGLSDGPARMGFWAVAILIEYVSPALGFHVPGLGRSSTDDWQISGGHIAERCALFVIIALGESILAIGASFSDLGNDAATIAAAVSSFVGSAAMWWIYFDVGVQRATRLMIEASNPGKLARLAYTYLHLPIIAGIIVVAVADELILAHPDGPDSLGLTLTATGGPALYLLGTLLFKWTTAENRRPPRSHLIGLAALLALAFAAPLLSPVALGVAASGVLVIVAILERLFTEEPDREDQAVGRVTDIPL